MPHITLGALAASVSITRNATCYSTNSCPISAGTPPSFLRPLEARSASPQPPDITASPWLDTALPTFTFDAASTFLTEYSTTPTTADVGETIDTATAPGSSPTSYLQGQGNPNVICGPAKWYYIATFLLINFGVHAATVKSLPGEQGLSLFMFILAALCVPFSGARRGIHAIATGSIFQKNGLGQALAAGALVVVVRTRSWRPVNGDVVEMCHVKEGILLARAEPAYDQLSSGESIRNVDDLTTSSLDRPPSNEQYTPNSLNTSGLDIEEDRETHLLARGALAGVAADETPSHVDPGSTGTGQSEHSGVGEALNPIRTVNTTHEQLDQLHVVDEALSNEPATSQENLPVLGQLTQTAFSLQISEKSFNFETQLTRRDVSLLKVHGRYHLPPGYALQILPPTVIVQSLQGAREVPGDEDEFVLSSSHSVVKVVAALLQIASSLFALWRAKANQIVVYGYTAFGLFVVPYAVMSVVNVFGNLFVADYAAVYLVRSEVMHEAERRDGGFDIVDGSVYERSRPSTTTSCTIRFEAQTRDGLDDGFHGALVDPPNASQKDLRIVPYARPDVKDHILIRPAGPTFQMNSKASFSTKYNAWLSFAHLLVIGIIFAIIGGLSNFRTGTDGSNYVPVFWYWIACSIFCCYGAEAMYEKAHKSLVKRKWTLKKLVPNVLLVIVWAIAVLFVCGGPFSSLVGAVIFQMRDFGECTRIPASAS